MRGRRVVLLVPLVFVGSALGVSGWQPPSDLSVPSPAVGDAAVTVDERGNATAVWQRSDGSNLIIQAATRSALTGRWTPPTDVSEPGQDAMSPRVVSDAAGNTTAVWRRSNGTNTIAQVSTRAASTGLWSPPTALSNPSGPAVAPDVAVDRAGNVTVVWWQSRLWAATRLAATGVWSAPVELAPAFPVALDYRVVTGRNGATVVAWSNGDRVIHAVVRASVDARWSAAAAVTSAGQIADDPSIAVDAQGTATLVWRRGGLDSVIQTSTRPVATEVWGAPITLSAPDDVVASGSSPPQIASDPLGNVTAIWARSDNVVLAGIQAATRSAATGAWSAPVELSTPGQHGRTPQITADGGRNVTVVWSRATPQGSVIQATSRSAETGAWSTPGTISTVPAISVSPVVSVDPQGNATAVWTDLTTPARTFKSAGYDSGAGPFLSGVIVPATAPTRASVRMQATAGDPISPPPLPPAWAFGDGRTSSGATTKHTYTRPGTYRVTVASTDGLGNTSTETRTITVTNLTLSKVRAACVRPRARGTCRARIAGTLSHPATIRVTVRTATGKLIGQASSQGRAGKNTFLLPKKLGKTILRKGVYRIVVQARIDGATSRKAKTSIRLR